MQLPAFTYPHPLPGAGLQAVHGADRPVCAAVAALAAWHRGGALLGTARRLTRAEQGRVLLSALDERGIPAQRAETWCRGIAATPLRECYDPHAAMPRTLAGLTPSQYQIDAALDLTVAGGLLGMAVGLGKTITSLYAAIAYTRQRWASKERLWIFCPLNAMGAWARYTAEMKTHFEDVRVVSIDSAHKLIGADRAAGGVLIIDEVHNAGHGTARRTKALFDIRLAFDTCIGLTGTLLHAGVEPALTMLDLAIPGAAGFATRWRAGDAFQCLVRKELGSRVVLTLANPVAGAHERFNTLMKTYSVMLTKHSPAVRSEVTIPEQSLGRIDFGGAGESIDDAIVRIALANVNPDDTLPHASAVLHLALAEGADAKVGWIMDNLDDEPVVLLAEYHATLKLMRDALDARKVPYSYVDGAVTGKARIEEVRKFQTGETHVFLGQVDAAGASIDLFRARVSVCIDHTQRATNYAQALGRTCRRGQVHECTHIDLVANAIQDLCVKRLRNAEDFHASLVTWQKCLDNIHV